MIQRIKTAPPTSAIFLSTSIGWACQKQLIPPRVVKTIVFELLDEIQLITGTPTRSRGRPRKKKETEKEQTSNILYLYTHALLNVCRQVGSTTPEALQLLPEEAGNIGKAMEGVWKLEGNDLVGRKCQRELIVRIWRENDQ